ncbi:hypothetical protein C1T30_41170 [Bacillus sp. MBGLi97]|nr:hypothetical protein C1T30_41170 [Bacillus sp. MBGLi97]
MEVVPLPRRSRSQKKINPNYLIICEGKATEVNYFNGIKRHIMLPTMNIKVFGIGKSKQELVKFAIGKRSKSRDEIKSTWVVFDKDDISNEDIDKTIKFAKDNNINVAFSNKCFELWLVLHFKEIDAISELTHSQLYKMVEKEFDCKDYKNNGKSNAALIDKIAGSYRVALKNSDKLYKQQNNRHRNPYCDVNKLVNELIGQ